MMETKQALTKGGKPSIAHCLIQVINNEKAAHDSGPSSPSPPALQNITPESFKIFNRGESISSPTPANSSADSSPDAAIKSFRISILHMGVREEIKTKKWVKTNKNVLALECSEDLKNLCLQPHASRSKILLKTAYETICRQFDDNIKIEGKDCVIQCPLCPAEDNILGTRIKKDLLDHINAMHLKHEIYSCCDHVFYTFKNFNRHHRDAHGHFPNKSAGKKLQISKKAIQMKMENAAWLLSLVILVGDNYLQCSMRWLAEEEEYEKNLSSNSGGSGSSSDLYHYTPLNALEQAQRAIRFFQTAACLPWESQHRVCNLVFQLNSFSIHPQTFEENFNIIVNSFR